jgi:uncharacterized membrane protein
MPWIPRVQDDLMEKRQAFALYDPALFHPEIHLRGDYGCWRRAENFPHFMDTMLEMKQMAKNQLCWVEIIDGQEFQTLVEISALSSGQCGFSWRTLSGPNPWGSIHFEARARGTTEVRVMMECLPEAGSPSPEAFEEKVEIDLAAFKKFVESSQYSYYL